MKKWVAIIGIIVFLAGAAATGLAKSKIWDMIFEDEKADGYTAEIRMSDGETFGFETTEADFDDVEFSGPIKVEREDGTYYLNSAQVVYIKVAAKKAEK